MTRCRLALLLPAVSLWLTSLGLPVPAATPQQYDRALAQVQAALVHQAQAMEAEEVPTGEAASLVAQRTLGPIRSIEAPGRAPVMVDTSALVAAIRTAEAVKDAGTKARTLEAVGGQITLLREELSASGAATDPASLRQSVRSVLARPEFASDPLPPPSVAERIAAWLDRHIHWPQPAAPNVNLPNVNPNVILGILIVIAAGAFALLVAVIVQAIGKRGARAKPLAMDLEETALAEARDNDSLLALAEQQAKSGDYRRAFRLVYLAALVALDTGGVLRFDRSKTNWEYLRALRAAGRGDIYGALTPLTREFDQVWYGSARADAGTYSRALAQYQALIAVPPGSATEAAQNPEAAQTVVGA